MTCTASRLVRLRAADHDRRRVIPRRLATDQALIPTRRVAAYDADRVKFVDHLGDGEQLRHRTEWLAAEVTVGAGENHACAAIGERCREIDDRWVEELGLIDRDDLRFRLNELRDLIRRIDR